MKEWTPNSKYGGHAFGLRNFTKFLAKRDKIMPWIKEYSPYANVSPDDPSVYLIYSKGPALGKEQKDPTHTSIFRSQATRALQVQGGILWGGLSRRPEVSFANPTEFLVSQLK